MVLPRVGRMVDMRAFPTVALTAAMAATMVVQMDDMKVASTAATMEPTNKHRGKAEGKIK